MPGAVLYVNGEQVEYDAFYSDFAEGSDAARWNTLIVERDSERIEYRVEHHAQFVWSNGTQVWEFHGEPVQVRKQEVAVTPGSE